MPMTASQEARADLYRSAYFRKEAAARLGHPETRLASCLDALLEARSLPATSTDNLAALAADAARILAAMASQQTKPASIVRITDRLLGMALQIEIGEAKSDAPKADIMKDLKGPSFASDVEAIIANLWMASRGTSAEGFRPTGITVLWSDERGSALFATIEQWSSRRQRIYANVELRAPDIGKLDFVRLPSVGGTTFSPIAIVKLAELLDDGAEDGPAGLDRVISHLDT